jgi:hypothetical protein
MLESERERVRTGPRFFRTVLAGRQARPGRRGRGRPPIANPSPVEGEGFFVSAGPSDGDDFAHGVQQQRGQLGAELQVVLLIREPRGVRLTPGGDAL